jgi:Holliday junction DNA helicase RuvA
LKEEAFMFSYIKGTVEYIGEESIVLENQGIGFQIKTSQNVINKLPGLHAPVTIFTYMYVREDEISLFGFLSKDEIQVFQLLIGISGIGPKAALAIMSCLTVEELQMAVLAEDAKAIAKANGVGGKTAQRVIIELKDKIKLEDLYQDYMDEDGYTGSQADADNASEVALALTSLGYSNMAALRAIKKVKDADAMSVEELLKAALKVI